MTQQWLNTFRSCATSFDCEKQKQTWFQVGFIKQKVQIFHGQNWIFTYYIHISTFLCWQIRCILTPSIWPRLDFCLQITLKHILSFNMEVRKILRDPGSSFESVCVCAWLNLVRKDKPSHWFRGTPPPYCTVVFQFYLLLFFKFQFKTFIIKL